MWHAIDRWVALCNTIFVASNFIWVSWPEGVYFAVSLVSGILLINTSRHHRIHGTTASFALWHTRWHLWFPLVLAVWLLWRVTRFG